MHGFFREMNVTALQRAQFTAQHLPEMVMTPREAYLHLVRNKVDYLPLDEIAGRIATTLFVIYPPGIATIIPGERLSERAQPMLQYLKMFERSGTLFPGFDYEIQGLYKKFDEQGRLRLYTYVVSE
jgi:ornithine decarboxylase/arginine decarboxylase